MVRAQLLTLTQIKYPSQKWQQVLILVVVRRTESTRKRITVYEQCSISSSLSSTPSSTNFPTIQINESIGVENVCLIENDLNDVDVDVEDDSAAGFNKYRYSHNSKKELDDPFLRDLTACLQMKHKKLTELTPEFTITPCQNLLQPNKASPTFIKPSFSFQPTPHFLELKLITRATSPICIDSSTGRLVNSSCSSYSTASISANSFNVVLKSPNSLPKSSVSHSSTQTDDECQQIIKKSLASLRSTEFQRTPVSPSPLISIRSIQKSGGGGGIDQDHLVKTKPTQLMSFNLEATPPPPPPPPLPPQPQTTSTSSSKIYATTSTNTETSDNETSPVTNRVDKYTNTDDLIAESAAILKKKTTETQTIHESGLLTCDKIVKVEAKRSQSVLGCKKSKLTF